MVSLGHYPSTDQKFYARFDSLMVRARLNGHVPIDSIVDNYRRLEIPSAWDNPEDFLDTARRSYRTDWWLQQEVYPIVWLEKDALSDLLEPVTSKYGVAMNVSRGYVSLSNMRAVCNFLSDKPEHICIYVGDHDPSGLDMERAIGDYEISDVSVQPERLAITHEQAGEYPSLRVKPGDTRSRAYIRAYGDHCWEIEAIPPAELVNMLEAKIREICNMPRLETAQQADRDARARFKFAVETETK